MYREAGEPTLGYDPGTTPNRGQKMLKYWMIGATSAALFGAVSVAASAAPASNAAGIRSTYEPASAVEQAADRRCWWRNGVRRCSTYRGRPRVYGYRYYNTTSRAPRTSPPAPRHGGDPWIAKTVAVSAAVAERRPDGRRATAAHCCALGNSRGWTTVGRSARFITGRLRNPRPTSGPWRQRQPPEIACPWDRGRP